MRVLLMNKFLFPNAGAESVFLATRDLLRREGHAVIDFAMRDHRNLSSEYSAYFPRGRDYTNGRKLLRLRDAASSVYSLDARRSLRRLLAAERPDVAHLHNVYHQLSLSVLDELHAARVPIVLTLHDYKPVCPSYDLYTDGAPCRRCVGGRVAPCVRHRCIKGSRPASIVAATEAALARRRGSWELVDRFIAPSRFMASVMDEGGVGSGKIRVIPNFLEPEPAGPVPGRRERSFLYVGRLEAVKGVRDLVTAASRPGFDGELRVVGEGPLRRELEEAARPNVRFLGRQPPSRVRDELCRAAALVVPSLWEENCPMVVLEARAAGVPVLCSDRGGLPELVSDGEDGLVFRAGDEASLLSALRAVSDDEGLAERLAERGRARLQRDHSAAGHYGALLEVYAEAAESVDRLRAVGAGD